MQKRTVFAMSSYHASHLLSTKSFLLSRFYYQDLRIFCFVLLFSEGRNPNTAAPVISVWPVSITTADGSTTAWAAETIGKTL